MIHHRNRIKDKNPMIISIEMQENAFDKIQHPFTNPLGKVGIQEKHLKIIELIYDKPTANVTLSGKKVNPFPSRSGTRQKHPHSPLLFNRVLEVLATATGQEEKEKSFELER